MKIKKFNYTMKTPFPILHKSMNKSYEYANKMNPELGDLLKQIFIILMMPLFALRAKMYRFFARFRFTEKLEGLNFPFFRIAVICIGMYLIAQKNISFSVNMNNATAMISKAGQTNVYDLDEELEINTGGEPEYYMTENEELKGEVVQTSAPVSNAPKDYAPVSVNQLEKSFSPKQYVLRYKDVARAEMKKYGIPASITLAQGLVESRAGSSRLAKENRNHFGIKCFSKNCQNGHCTNHFDDNHKDFFRKYNSVWQSFRDHSKLLQKPRYGKLKSYKKNYKKWAKGLQKAGYATDQRYAKKLISTIEKYNLQQYDK